jgi:hypothetical protein
MIDWWCADKRYEHTHWTVGDLAFDVARQAKVKRANPTAGGKVFNLKANWQLHNTGKECCQSMQCKAYDFKETMWKKAKAAVRANEDCYPRKMDVCVKEKHRLEECRAWWKGHVKVFGCDMPELGHISINNIPWTDLYENYYCVECYDDTAASRTTWDTARHVEFGNSLVRRKKKRGLSKCNTCAHLDKRWDNAKDAEYPKNERQLIKRLKLQHNNWQGLERKVCCCCCPMPSAALADPGAYVAAALAPALAAVADAAAAARV